MQSYHQIHFCSHITAVFYAKDISNCLRRYNLNGQTNFTKFGNLVRFSYIILGLRRAIWRSHRWLWKLPFISIYIILTEILLKDLFYYETKPKLYCQYRFQTTNKAKHEDSPWGFLWNFYNWICHTEVYILCPTLVYLKFDYFMLKWMSVTSSHQMNHNHKHTFENSMKRDSITPKNTFCIIWRRKKRNILKIQHVIIKHNHEH